MPTVPTKAMRIRVSRDWQVVPNRNGERVVSTVHSFKNRHVLSGLVAMVASAALVAACSSSAATPGSTSTPAATAAPTSAPTSAGGGLKIAFIGKATTDPYFTYARTGADKAVAELGDQLIWTGSADKDPTHQVAAIQSVLQQKPDIIVVAALDQNAISPVLRQAMQAGVTVVTFDSDSLSDARDLFVNMMTYEIAAQTYLDAALMDDPTGGKVAFMAATPSTTNQVEQINAMKQLMSTNPKYKVFTPGDTYYVNDDATQAATTMTNVMQAHPDVKFMLSGSANDIPAACQAIETAGKQGKVFAVGAALPSAIKTYLKDGSEKAEVLWSPADLAYLSIYAGVAVHSGQLKVVQGASLTAGTLGSFSVADNNSINLNKPVTFTKDNVDQYNF